MVSYNQAAPDAIYKDIYDPPRGCDASITHSPFVNDTLIVNNRCPMPTAMAASIESLSVVLDYEKLSERRSSIGMDKFYVHKSSWKK